MYIAQYFIHADEIGHEIIRNHKRYQPKHRDFGQPLSDFESIPGHGFQLLLFVEVAINPILYFPENHLHEDGLRTGPSAEHPPENHCEQDDENHKSDHAQGENEEVLRTKDLAKQDEFSFEHIEHDEGFPIDLDPGQREEYDQVDD
jgi:hypothetical protein